MSEVDGLESRRAAFEVLESVLLRKRALDETFERDERVASLSSRDRAFCRLLVLTVLRRRGQLDDIIARFVARRPKGSALSVLQILRLGLAQLLFLDTRPHAAVDSAVRLCEAKGFRGFKGLVNAVLRRAVQDGAGVLSAQDAERLNTPDWLWRSWCDSYGEATARRIAAAGIGEPPVDVSARADAAAVAAQLSGHLSGHRLFPTGGTVRLTQPGDITRLPGFEAGDWWVQDAAASLPVPALGDVAGKGVIDLCAAPGGKTAQLLAAGARVTAVDRSAPRLDRLRANLQRLRFDATVVTADAATWRPEALADAVLLDAPCSASGTLRRHPDIAWLKGPADVASLAALQHRLLAAAADMVKPGGVVVYATCSLQKEEGEAHMERLAEIAPSLEIDPIAAEEMPVSPALFSEIRSANGWLRTLPCHMADEGGMDGFFIARLRKR